MFKDYKKYLTVSIKVYLFVLLFIFILKLVGLDYFGINDKVVIIQKIDSVCSKYGIVNVFYALTLYINLYIISSLVLKDNSRKLKIHSIFLTIFSIFIQIIESHYPNTALYVLIDFIYIFLFIKIYNHKVSFKRYIIISILFLLYQVITLMIRNINYAESNSFIINFILSIDYVILQIITYKVYFMKGENELCGMEAFLSSLKKISLKKSLLNLRKNYQNNLEKFREKSTQDKLTIIIFIILSLLWNTFTVLLIIFVAHINDTFIECLFILSSFWLSKGKFGKPFHFESMITCFIVSNLTYYTLNRVTTPIGISILIPILLGVGLSYVTSKFVKKEYKPLYRGMPLETFEETILKVEEKDSIKYKICKEFYINKISDLSLSFKYNYSVSGIRKIKSRINEKIKKLN